jgi:hypothetical protein
MSSGKTSRPAGVIRPSSNNLLALRRFFSDQLDPGRRGVKRIAQRSSSTFTPRESIQP